MVDKQEELSRDRAQMDAKMSELEIELFRDVFDELDEERHSAIQVNKVEATLRKAGVRFQGEQMQKFQRVLLETAGIDHQQSEGKVINFAQFLDLANMMIKTNFADARSEVRHTVRRASSARI
jgi:Ca2+-binding EF-hand superfamily protein